MPSANGEGLAKKVITFEQLGAFVVLSPRQLQRLAKDGIISLARDKRGRTLRGRVILGEALPRLFEYAREHASGDPSVARFRAARAQREEAEAELARIELDAKRGEYFKASDVEETNIRILTMVRARCLAIPASISRSLIGLTDFKRIYQIVEDAIHRALHELADLGDLARERNEAASDEEFEALTAKQRQKKNAFFHSETKNKPREPKPVSLLARLTAY